MNEAAEDDDAWEYLASIHGLNLTLDNTRVNLLPAQRYSRTPRVEIPAAG
jgi:hypothetical protein